MKCPACGHENRSDRRSARAEYYYAYNTNCAVCSVVDNGVMVRVGLPGG